MNEMLLIIQAPITSILSAVVMYMCYFCAKNYLRWGGRLKPKTMIVSLIVAFFILPLPFLIYIGDLFSPYVIGIYTRELIISTFIAIPVVVVWNVAAKVFRRLMLLIQLKRLSLIEQLDLDGKTWIALEQNRITDDEAREIKIRRSLRRWIIQGNDIGWYELKAQIGDKKLTDLQASLQASWTVSRELTKIRQEKMKGIVPERNHGYENNLASLLPTEQVGVVWQKWDAGLATEDMARETLELNAFKKWMWKNDETGWLDLKHIRQNKKAVSPMVVEFAKFELWEIEKKKTKRETIDLSKEKKLKSLVLT